MGTTLPLIPLPYSQVLFPGKTLQISPAGREDVVAIISKYYSGALRPKTKDNASLIGCIPLRSPYLSPDGRRLIEDGQSREENQPEPDASKATKDDLFDYGCIAKISGIKGGRSGDVALVVEGLSRFKLESIAKDRPYFEGHAKEFKDVVDVWDPAVKAAFSQLKELSRELFQIVRMSSLVTRGANFPPLLARQLEAFVARKDISEAGFLADFMAVLGSITYEDKLWLLSATSIVKRLQRANELLHKQITTLQGNTRIVTITNTSQGNIDQERLKQLQKDQGRSSGLPPGFLPGGTKGGSGQSEDSEENEVEELKKRLDEARLSPEAQKVATRELKRLAKMNPAQAEYSVIRNYLENLAEIPWTNVSDDKLDGSTLSRARKQLDDDHFGLEKIKKRLLEYLAVLRLKQAANTAIESQIQAIVDRESEQSHQPQQKEHKKTTGEAEETQIAPAPPAPKLENTEVQLLKRKQMVDKSPILLLVGPPGTGKTSLAKSVATALGRKFHRISLGGVRDEAEIRGHRRTYVAAMPGLIVSGLKKVGVANPVFLLDEIDKVGTSNFHGDPSAAMLEVLDPEQNHSFNDHYVNVPIDLSKVLFIATANTLDTIPPPLLDRMETITLSGYTTIEKRNIAVRHLVPKQITTNGLQQNDVDIPEEVVDKIITAYTRESGVRNLEREIGSVCRAKAVQFAESKDSGYDGSHTYKPSVHMDDLEEILGIERFEEEVAAQSQTRPGVVTGLVAFSNLGQGSILFIEVAEMPGKGKVQLTGKLGDVLKESVEVALTWVKAHAFELGVSSDPQEDIMARRDIHVHCPAGAIPKDGPSAGLAHTVALISLFTSRAVPPSIAMTGEVSLRGKVTPVGGIKEKLIGALRAGVKTVLLPSQNRKDIKDCPEEVKSGLDIIHVSYIWEALRVVWPEEKWQPKWEVESRL